MDDSEKTTAEKSAETPTISNDDATLEEKNFTSNNDGDEMAKKRGNFVIPSVSIENANSQESILLSVIQENEEIDQCSTNRAKNCVDGNDQCDSSLVKIDVFKRPLSPNGTKKAPFNHRLSVPSILEPDSQKMCRSSSFQNLNSSSLEQQETENEEDDELDEKNLHKNKANLSSIVSSDAEKRRLMARHRKASLSAIFLPVLSSTASLGTSEFYVKVPKMDRNASDRENTPDESPSLKNDQLLVNQKPKRPLSINFVASSSMLNVSQSFDEKSMSASTPSVKELCDQAANIVADEENAENFAKNVERASSEETKDESPSAKPKITIVDNNTVIVRTKKSSQQSRGPSLYIPSITPRLPLKGFLPGSMRRLNEKLNDLNQNNNNFKPKDKERRSFFKHKSKSKELRQHHSWSNPSFKVNICDLCAKKSSNNQELLHCSDCGINVHPSCKDQAEKFGCPKSEKSSLKNSRDETDQKNGRISSFEEPVHVLARRKTIDEENCDKSDNDNVIIRTSSLSSGNNNNINNRGSMTSLIKNQSPLSLLHPNGFYAATSPDALWDELNLWAEEPEAWSSGVGKLEKKRLTSREIKRQDIMHELYITEKHHCQILVVLKHTYFDTLVGQNMIPAEELDKLLPKLDHLLNLHRNFLRNLKNRKDECVIVETIHDVIYEQFTNDNAKLLTEAYTQFCAQKDLTDGIFQKFLQNNLHYQNFIKHLSSIQFYKSRTLRDCLLLVTQRLSKYHTFVENLRKNTPDDYSDKERMQLAEKVVKDVIAAVDSGIERIQLDRFSKEIAQNMDSRSTSIFNNAAFTAKDLLLSERILLYYCSVHWQNAKRVPADVLMLLYTDLVAFLMQNGAGGPYSFYSQDKKPSVISLQKMIVRDKAGRLGTDGIYLIATQPKPEMYEIKCRTKKETHVLAAKIQSAIDKYPTQKLVPSPVEERASEIVPKTVALLNDGDLEELEALFAKFLPTNDKLKSYFDDLLVVFEEIREFVTELMSRPGTEGDREKVARIFNDHVTSYLESIKPQVIVRRLLTENANISATKRQMMNDFLNAGDLDVTNTNSNTNNNGSFNDETTDMHSQTSSSAPNFDDSSSTTGTAAPSETSTMSSSINGNNSAAVSRSNTFHGRVRNSIRRTQDMIFQSINKTVSTTDSGHASDQNFAKNILPNQFMVKSKLEMLALRQLNAKLETEVALLKEECKQHRENLQKLQQDQKKLTTATTTTAAISHSRQSSADSTHQTLEELRRLHANLDEKKQNFLRMVDEKEREFKNREAILAEKEAKLNLDDQELRSRWEQLYKAWDQKRFGSSSTTTPVDASPPLPSTSPFRRSNSILMSSRNAVRHSLSSSDVLSNVKASGNFPTTSASASRLQRPPQLPSPVDEDPPSPFPLDESSSSKLPTPVTGFARFYPLGRSSLKAKKWHSTSKLTRNPSSVSSLGLGGASQQLLPSKLESSNNLGSSSKKK